ncbi:MAG: aspartate--tRNA ligase [Clostridia bacterium]|nr:aspartate--tRNA ligase [Clostridia bacterium]
MIMYRTDYCGTLTKADIGREVKVCGWVQKQRDLGTLIFVDLRDRTGIVQLAFDENKNEKEVFDRAFSVRSETVVCAVGTVRSRGEGAINHDRATGEIEIEVREFEVLSVSETPPFEIVENSDVREELRFRYRYLDLRRPDIQRNIIERHKIVKLARDFFSDNGFLEIETPILIKSTPEGARDYLVPSRVHPGHFYALPQSPQIYKQILMLSGYDRYMQIAKCFRDEDLRADRQPEFTQLDLEMSFVTQDDVMEVNERFLAFLFEKYLGQKLELPLLRLPYEEAMARFGSDKPDLRYEMELCDLSEVVRDCGFSVFSSTVQGGGAVLGLCVKGGAETYSRKEIDRLTEFAKTYKARGLAYARLTAEPTSSFAKFLTDAEYKAVLDTLGAETGDLVLIVADARRRVAQTALGAVRTNVAAKLGLCDPKKFALCWVTDFPMFEYSEEEDRYVAMHHPFTAPRDEDLQYLESDPARVYAKAYDIVINGNEAGGGSERIHRRDVQAKVFSALGISDEEANEKFGFLLEAFRYGAPPHAGLAFGVDRLVSLLLGLDAIRDCIAFPKMQNAMELMSAAPGTVPQKALDELSISLNVKSDE